MGLANNKKAAQVCCLDLKSLLQNLFRAHESVQCSYRMDIALILAQGEITFYENTL